MNKKQILLGVKGDDLVHKLNRTYICSTVALFVFGMKNMPDLGAPEALGQLLTLQGYVNPKPQESGSLYDISKLKNEGLSPFRFSSGTEKWYRSVLPRVNELTSFVTHHFKAPNPTPVALHLDRKFPHLPHVVVIQLAKSDNSKQSRLMLIDTVSSPNGFNSQVGVYATSFPNSTLLALSLLALYAPTVIRPYSVAFNFDRELVAV